MTQRKTLSEEDKINIIVDYNALGARWTDIGKKHGINPNTVRTFINRYKKNHTISPKMGRPIEITAEIKDAVIGAAEADPEISLRDISDIFDISTTSARSALNEDGIKYFQKIPVPPLTATHMQNRVNFATQFAQMAYANMPSLIFTDESTVEVNLNGGGIWRRRGEYPPGSFYEKVAHPVSCMIWGAIGPKGFRTKLIKVDGTLNADEYVRMLYRNMVPQQIFNIFGNNYVFQQDNARPHIAKRAQNYLNRMFPRILNWPAKSPDLSPIEQVWD